MRIRTLKPELLEDERTARLGHLEWRLFISLILLADDYGNLRADPERIRGVALWAHVDPLEEPLVKLETIGLIRLYQIDNQRYAHILKWNRHQKVDHPGKPGCPPPPALSRDPRDSVAPDQYLDQDQEKDQDPDHGGVVGSGDYGEFDSEKSWELTKDVWSNAGPWTAPGGENLVAARKKFAVKINAANWPAFIRGLDWAVTNSISRGRDGRRYLGLLYTFITEEKWVDQSDPNAKAPAPPEVPQAVTDQFFITFMKWPAPLEGSPKENAEDAMKAFSQVLPDDWVKFHAALDRRIRMYKNAEGPREERLKYLGLFRNFCSKWRDYAPVERVVVPVEQPAETTDEDDE